MKIKFEAKTRPWKIAICVILIFIIFLILWILFCEIDIYNLDWIVPHNGILWKGKITAANYDWLITKYPNVIDQLEINKSIEIYNKGSLIFDWNLLWIFILPIVFSILLTLSLRILKLANIDMLPFIFSISICLFVLFVISNFIPYWENNQLWRWMVRILISVSSFFILFFPTNFIVGKIMFKSKNHQNYLNNLKAEKNAIKLINEESNNAFDQYKKSKDKEITYIDT